MANQIRSFTVEEIKKAKIEDLFLNFSTNKEGISSQEAKKRLRLQRDRRKKSKSRTKASRILLGTHTIYDRNSCYTFSSDFSLGRFLGNNLTAVYKRSCGILPRTQSR